MTEQLDTHPVAGVLTCVRRVLDQGVAVWHRFWFDPLDPLMLGMMRLLTGWMLFYNLLVWSLQLETFFGRNGLQPLGAVKRLYESRFVFSFWLWVDDQYLWPVHIACLVVAAMFCIGAATRVTSILAFLITISYSQRVPVANFGFDQVLGMMCLYLAMAPCGTAISVDNLLRKWWLRRKSPVANFTPIRFASARMASRLIQLHLCAIDFWAGFSKLKGPTWWTGEAMWNVIANQEYQTAEAICTGDGDSDAYRDRCIPGDVDVWTDHDICISLVRRSGDLADSNCPAQPPLSSPRFTRVCRQFHSCGRSASGRELDC